MLKPQNQLPLTYNNGDRDKDVLCNKIYPRRMITVQYSAVQYSPSGSSAIMTADVWEHHVIHPSDSYFYCTELTSDQGVFGSNGVEL